MAYRRKHGISRASTFKEEIHHRNSDENTNYRPSSLSSSLSLTKSGEDHHKSKSFDAYEDASKSGFWGVLAKKAKEILEDDNPSPHQYTHIMPQKFRSHSFNTTVRVQEGRRVEESKITDLKTPIKPEGTSPKDSNPWQQSIQTTNSQPINETRLKASRDVAMATAAKAKLLLRELKTVKADLAFAKARCAQLEEENKLLRNNCEGREKGQNRADDDLIRLQLETLLAEKGRLANENEIYARENRFLREIVEYHQLNTQDVVYLDEGMEEVTELYPLDTTIGDTVNIPRMISMSPRSPLAGRPAQSKTIFPVPLEEDQEQDKAPPRISLSISKD